MCAREAAAPPEDGEGHPGGPPLATIAQKLGQMEKDKLAAIQLKIGRPADLVKTGRVIRARIGIAAKGPDGTGAAMAVELESSDDKTSLAEDA